jgi:hypothetical protein
MAVLSAFALGVSILAIGVSIWGAVSARRSAKAADESNANNLGPAITVHISEELRERWNYSPQGLPDNRVGYPPGVCPVDRTWVVPANVGVWMLLGVHVTLFNEGQRTTSITINAFRVDRCDTTEEIAEVLAPPAEKPSPALPQGRFFLAPGQSAGVIIRQGLTVGEWFENQNQIPNVTIDAKVSDDGSEQHWKLELEGELLQPEAGNHSGCRAVPHRPPKAVLTELRRTYPLAIGSVRIRRHSIDS